MKKEDNNHKKLQDISKTEIYRYPEPKKIEINEADFLLKLERFKHATKNRPSWGDFLLLAPAWVILLTSNFQGFWLFTGQHLKGAYFSLIAIGSVNIIGRIFKGIKTPLFISRLLKDDHRPEKLIENIKEAAQQNKK